ncbi:hypothetical protein JZO76_03200 [Enterococcus sp. MJM12]|uniref:Uncharacterized protein n=1 Tax=Candidatus Enterococcus myersii TaxID=2815322 RepID=A0ABS3H530_9ENTE|nr:MULTISPECIES: hypothetical protein [Enterococcus]MBO0448534.1 hypothetical protein [Enterococcus sp. MJM12]MCD1025079.1 hypothetical protein [Enterococcus sp. SMC-9]MDT2740548.1 hypothetical protein [Enterococcus canintestini]WHA10435.1 hypothetical protein P3T75_06415 [Enterococcus montenegrensis]
MDNIVRCMSFKQLKAAVAKLEATAGITEETKIFLDTGWDSLQEVSPESIEVKKARYFEVQDPVSKEYFGGFALSEKAEKVKATGAEETVIVIENLY